MNSKNPNFNQFLNLVASWNKNKFRFDPSISEDSDNLIEAYKKGNKIHIKKENRGKFTEYCGGNVTSECISKGKHSSDPKIRKRATFAANARKWKHKEGGIVSFSNNRQVDFSYLFNK